MAKLTGKSAGRKEIFLRMGLIFLILGIIMLVMNKDNFRTGFMKPYDIYAEDADANNMKKGDAISTEIYAVLDTFGTLETTHTTNGAVTSRSYSYFYIIPVFDEYDTYYIAIEVSSDDRELFESIADDTWDYMTGVADDFTRTPFEFNGNVHKLDDEAYGYMVEWFEEAEWFESDSDIEKYVWPLCLEKVSFTAVRTLSLIGIGLTLLGIVFFVLYFTTGSKKKDMAAQTAGGYDGTINIAGVKYTKSDFDMVNSYVTAGDTASAVRAVRDRTGLSEEEARTIVENWSIYYK